MNIRKCICCSTQTAPLSIKDQFLSHPLQYCSNCHHIQLLELPHQQKIKKYYEQEYSKDRSSYIGEYYFNIMKNRAISQLNFINHFFELHRRKKVFDIGCGYGFLVDYAKKHFDIEAKGIEFDPNAVNYCRNNGLSVNLIKEEKEIVDIEKVDLVLMSHVLEHLIEPIAVLTQLKARTKFIFIEVPTYDVKIRQQFINQEGHLNFFTEKSLKMFLDKLGFKIVFLASYGPSMNFFWKQKYYFLRRIYRYINSGDYFFEQYDKTNINGIWIRTILEVI